MQQQRLSSLFFYFIISLLMMLIGCSKQLPILDMPEPLPPIVKQYKHKTIKGNVPHMQNTGLYLNKGDFSSILATGSIDIWPSGPRFHESRDVRPGSDRFIARIGTNNYIFHPIAPDHNSGMSFALDSGTLYLGIRDGRGQGMGGMTSKGKSLKPEWYRDNIGSFSVDIIVWAKEDYVQIVDFFGKMKEQDPENLAIINAYANASRDNYIYLGSAKVSKEIQVTRKKLQELQGSKGEEIAQLQAKLSELTESLKQYENMKERLEDEKRKTIFLTTDHFEFDTGYGWNKAEREIIGKIGGNLDDIWERVNNRLGGEVPPQLNLSIIKHGIYSTLIREENKILLNGVHIRNQSLKDCLERIAHETAHIALYKLSKGKILSNENQFIDEGIAIYIGILYVEDVARYNTLAQKIAKEDLRNGKASLDYLRDFENNVRREQREWNKKWRKENPGKFPTQDDFIKTGARTYFTAYSLIKAFKDKYGLPKLLDVVRSMGAGESQSDAFEKVMGQSLDEFVSEWHASLK